MMLLFKSIWEASIYLEKVFAFMKWRMHRGDDAGIPTRLEIMQELQDMRQRLLADDDKAAVYCSRLMVCRLRDEPDMVVCGLDAESYLQWERVGLGPEPNVSVRSMTTTIGG